MKIVNFDDTQKVTLDDFNNLATDPRDAMDAVVGKTIEAEAKYSGGTVTRTATTKITVGTPLYLFKQGRIYSRDDLNGIEIDLLAHLPTSGNKRIVAIVLQGQEIEDETEERDFEVDGTVFPPVVEAQPKTTRFYRRCEVSVVVGTAAPTPAKPAIDTALLPVAYVTLTSTEVSASIEQVEDNRIVPLGAAVFDLDNWNLDGGITDIDLLLQQIAPDPAITTITFEARIGGIWVPMQAVTTGNHPLYGQPASVDARMVLQGTTELMPGIHVGTSYVTLSRPRTSFTHISLARATGVNVNEVEITALLEHYLEANHDCTAALLVGAGFDTEEIADAVSDQILPDGTVKRTWTFTGLTPTQSYKRKFTGATSSALSVFHVAEVTDAAYPA